MEDNKDNSVKETEQKPQEQTEGKTGGKTMAEKAIDRFAQMMVTLKLGKTGENIHHQLARW